MRKRTAALLVSVLIAGWALGWYSRDRWQVAPGLSGAPQNALPSRPTTTRESVGRVAAARPGNNDEIGQLLEDKAYAAVVERYEALQAQADDTVAQHAKGQVLDHARRLIAQADFASAIQLLQLYLQVAYRDVEARLLLADAYRGANDPRAAIEQLYESKGQAYRPGMLDQLTRRLRAVVTEYADRLQKSGDSSGLLELYQNLTQFEPSYAPYFIGLAMAQLALEDNEAARQSLLLVAQDPQVGAQARELLERVRVAMTEPRQPEPSVPATEVTGIPLLRSGSHFLVDARLGNAQPVRLLIDTGASLTMLTPDILERRGIGAHATGRTGTFNTANGKVRAPIYRLDALTVGDWQVSNLDVAVLELSDAGIDGLLGMNFLRRFQFFIDQNEASLRLSIAAESK